MIFINDIIAFIQNSASTKSETPPTTDPPLESSAEVSKDDVDTAEFRWVIVRGAGLTSDEAKQDAWRNAIEQVAGVFITADSQIENGQLVKDNIVAHSNAYIEEFKLLDEDIKGGIVRVQIKAKVATKMLLEKLESLGGELKYRSVDGESKHAKIVTQNQRTKSAIETLPAAMHGYPEELFDIEIGETRMAMNGVFDDGKEHLIVPVTFSWNNKAWITFSNNLKEYLSHVSNDTSSFKLRLHGLILGSQGRRTGEVDKSLFRNDSWYKQGWERAWLAGETSIFGKTKINEKLKGMFSYDTVNDQVVKSYTHDYIYDVVVILDSRLKSGTSFAVTREIWDSLLQKMKQVPAFYLHAMTKDHTEIGRPSSGNEFHYSTYKSWDLTSLPFATGLDIPHNLPDSITDLRGNFDESKSKNSPRVMIISPYFMMDFDDSFFNNYGHCYASTYTYDYIINLELDEVHELDRVEIEPYVLDLHNKKRRDNGSR